MFVFLSLCVVILLIMPLKYSQIKDSVTDIL